MSVLVFDLNKQDQYFTIKKYSDASIDRVFVNNVEVVCIDAASVVLCRFDEPAQFPLNVRVLWRVRHQPCQTIAMFGGVNEHIEECQETCDLDPDNPASA